MKRKTYYYSSYTDDFGITENVKKTIVGDDYKYNPSNLFSFLWYYLIAMPIAFLIMKISFHYKFINKKIIKEVKKTGFYVYANHTNFVGDALMPSLLQYRRNNIIVRSDTVSITGIKHLVKDLGALPLGDTYKASKNLLKEMKKRIEKKESITIYPEAHIWPYYTGIRPFSSSCMKYPIMMGVPSIAMTICYQRRRFGNKPKMVVCLDGPFYPDLDLPNKEREEKLADDIYAALKTRTMQYSTYSINEYIHKPKEESK
ncbi:1-acyl-sn-glycerol-3-phosphate acyltransferase [Anaeroplasma bactoclasticum]|jgi:1-acyl-sn-glycerol-3-phosphate acyltransferase|uniref:1-acyl-sn-glycerol-3-phosphate acyltransferase n=1 Tax=Anaeroplasma bactoclasticum TaxID=2088 RepID=A0A397RV83_9MOLU|nr:1-acyl-sn-glycerol-3-phosphate acyltransferase [Anaeroplasma bactoclasticum]RIA75527.1 1-acyl-sn-glycerol-3-phosphate acyltransferase [Anaeroplasma bactoclasticum]